MGRNGRSSSARSDRSQSRGRSNGGGGRNNRNRSSSNDRYNKRDDRSASRGRSGSKFRTDKKPWNKNNQNGGGKKAQNLMTEQQAKAFIAAQLAQMGVSAEKTVQFGPNQIPSSMVVATPPVNLTLTQIGLNQTLTHMAPALGNWVGNPAHQQYANQVFLAGHTQISWGGAGQAIVRHSLGYRGRGSKIYVVMATPIGPNDTAVCMNVKVSLPVPEGTFALSYYNGRRYWLHARAEDNQALTTLATGPSDNGDRAVHAWPALLTNIHMPPNYTGSVTVTKSDGTFVESSSPWGFAIASVFTTKNSWERKWMHMPNALLGWRMEQTVPGVVWGRTELGSTYLTGEFISTFLSWVSYGAPPANGNDPNGGAAQASAGVDLTKKLPVSDTIWNTLNGHVAPGMAPAPIPPLPWMIPGQQQTTQQGSFGTPGPAPAIDVNRLAAEVARHLQGSGAATAGPAPQTGSPTLNNNNQGTGNANPTVRPTGQLPVTTYDHYATENQMTEPSKIINPNSGNSQGGGPGVNRQQ